MGNQMSHAVACDGHNIVDGGLDPVQPPYYAPVAHNGYFYAKCQTTVNTGAVYRLSSQSSWYDCAYSCDLNALCAAVTFEPAAGSCKEYSTYAQSSEAKALDTQLMYRSAIPFGFSPSAQGVGCVPGVFDGYQIECGIDYAGGDIGSQHDMLFKDCIDLCSTTTGCIDVAYNGGSCYLKGSLGPRVSNGAVWTARKDGATQGLSCENRLSDGQTYNGFEIACGIDYYGNDIGSASTPSFEQCIDRCADTSGCVDVSYTGNMCYMKDKVGQLASNGAVWTAKKAGTQSPTNPSGPTCVNKASDATIYTGAKGDYNIHCDFEYYGGDLAHVRTATFVECITACDNTEGCIDVSYTGDHCYMKNNLSRQRRASGVSTAVLLSEVKPGAPDSLTCIENRDHLRTWTAAGGHDYIIECGADYYGGDLSASFASTFQVCIDQCDAAQGCVAVAFRDTNCYLKSERQATKSDAGVWGARRFSAADPPPSTTTTTTTTTTTSAAATSTTTSSITQPACLESQCQIRRFDRLDEPCCENTLCDIASGFGNRGQCRKCAGHGNICSKPSDCCTPGASCVLFGGSEDNGYFGYCGYSGD